MIAFALLTAPAWAQPSDDAPLDAPPVQSSVEISGFVSPGFVATVRPNAVPEDRLNAGINNSRAGIIFAGEPAQRWAFKAYLLVGEDSFLALTEADAVDLDNDGSVDTLATSARAALGDIVRETSITWAPFQVFDVKLGRMPIPFTSQAQSADTALLFPERSGPNQIFLADDDLGGLAGLNIMERVLLRAGVFNGSGAGPLSSSDQGALYTVRLDVHPLGEFGFDESRPGKGPFRLGLGAGLAHHPYTTYDSAGYADVEVSDFRGSLSARLAVAGLSLSGEYLKRLQTDSLTARPVEATGGYGQLGWYLPVGIEPIARAGATVEDQSFAPRNTIWTDAGVNVYPRYKSETPDAVRVTAQYLSENRVTEGELARGASVQAQVKW